MKCEGLDARKRLKTGSRELGARNQELGARY
jgi:hypothetical protein